MPSFKSKAQIRLFARDPKLRQYLKQWMDETPNPDALPEKVGMDMTLSKEAVAKTALAVLMGKEAACVKKKGPYKRTGKSLSSLESRMNSDAEKQTQKDASAGEKALMGALGAGAAGLSIYQLLQMASKIKDRVTDDDSDDSKKDELKSLEQDKEGGVMGGLLGLGGGAAAIAALVAALKKKQSGGTGENKGGDTSNEYFDFSGGKDRNPYRMEDARLAPNLEEFYKRMPKDKDLQEMEYQNEINSW